MKKSQIKYEDGLDRTAAAEMFEAASFFYSTKDVEETVSVLKKLGLEKIAEKALRS